MGVLEKDPQHRRKINNLPINGQTVDQSKRPVIDKSKFYKTYEEAYTEGECDGSFNERQRSLNTIQGLRGHVKNLKKKIRALENK